MEGETVVLVCAFCKLSCLLGVLPVIVLCIANCVAKGHLILSLGPLEGTFSGCNQIRKSVFLHALGKPEETQSVHVPSSSLQPNYILGAVLWIISMST